MHTKPNVLPRQLLSLTTGLVVMLICTTCKVERTKGDFTAAPPAYSILAEKSLDLIASFKLDTWSTMLSDSVICYFPDGDVNTRTKLVGKKALLEWSQKYIQQSGIQSMSIESAHYLPMDIINNSPEEMPGPQVIAYLSNKMVFNTGMVSVRMNVIIHFDKNKMIDRYYAYYDNTPIINTLNAQL